MASGKGPEASPKRSQLPAAKESEADPRLAQIALGEQAEILPDDLNRQLNQQFDRLKLSPQARAELSATVQTVVLQTEKTHSGPLPAVEDYAGYGAVLDTAPERIMVMAEKRIAMGEKQQSHDHRIEFWTLLSETSYRLVGLLAGALLIAGMIGASAYCAHIGAYVAAAAWGAGGAITGVGGIFVRGRDIAGMKNSAPTPKPIDPPRSGGRGVRQGNRNRGRN